MLVNENEFIRDNWNEFVHVEALRHYLKTVPVTHIQGIDDSNIASISNLNIGKNEHNETTVTLDGITNDGQTIQLYFIPEIEDRVKQMIEDAKQLFRQLDDNSTIKLKTLTVNIEKESIKIVDYNDNEATLNIPAIAQREATKEATKLINKLVPKMIKDIGLFTKDIGLFTADLSDSTIYFYFKEDPASNVKLVGKNEITSNGTNEYDDSFIASYIHDKEKDITISSKVLNIAIKHNTAEMLDQKDEANEILFPESEITRTYPCFIIIPLEESIENLEKYQKQDQFITGVPFNIFPNIDENIDAVKAMFNGIVSFTYPEGKKQGQTTAALKIATPQIDYTTVTTYINYRE